MNDEEIEEFNREAVKRKRRAQALQVSTFRAC